MSGERMLHFLKDWWKFIQIHQYYIMALIAFIQFGLDVDTLECTIYIRSSDTVINGVDVYTSNPVNT